VTQLRVGSSSFVRYLGTILINLVALVSVFLLEREFPHLLESDFPPIPFMLFLCAVIFSSWYGGRIAGLAAVAF
jgi:hypothetical protein